MKPLVDTEIDVRLEERPATQRVSLGSAPLTCLFDSVPLTPRSLWKMALSGTNPRKPPHLVFSPDAWQRIHDAAGFIERLLAGGDQAIYGLNTGFGHFAERVVSPSQLRQLQRNLIVSH